LRILVTGAKGLIGTSLVRSFQEQHIDVIPLARMSPSWDPGQGIVMPETFEGINAVIHLAGANIASKRWTKRRMRELFQSRCRDTWLLSHALSRLKKPPSLFVSVSAIGYYGDRGEASLTEESGPGTGFLAELCQQWERASEVLEAKGIRVVHPRLGSVITPKGGMVAKLLPLFKRGFGAVLGTGEQWFSWIALEDAIAAFHHVLKREDLRGPVNFTSPHSVRNKELSEALSRACHKKLRMRIPAPLLRLALGKMAGELLLASTKVYPEKLIETGFVFKKPEFAAALIP